MTSLSSVTQTLEQIGRVQAGLLNLRSEIGASNPDLFRILAEGPMDMLRDLQRDLEHQLGLSETAEVEADLWIRLEGEAIQEHAAPMSVMVSILDAFRKGVTAVGEMLQFGRLSTRPTAAIKDATDLRVVALAPGSLQIALTLPEPPRQLPLNEELQEGLGQDAVRTLLAVANWAGSTADQSELERLIPDSSTRKTYLSALQRVIPRPRGRLSVVEFRGRMVPSQSGTPIRLRKETNQRVAEAIDRAVHEEVVTHEGVLREIDLDQASVRIRSVDGVGEVRGSFSVELLQIAVEALDRPVRVTGIVRAEEGRRGFPRLEITRLELMEDVPTVEPGA